MWAGGVKQHHGFAQAVGDGMSRNGKDNRVQVMLVVAADLLEGRGGDRSAVAPQIALEQSRRMQSAGGEHDGRRLVPGTIRASDRANALWIAARRLQAAASLPDTIST